MSRGLITSLLLFSFPLSMSNGLRSAHSKEPALDSHFTVHAYYLGKMRTTAYRSLPCQTDTSPDWTSIGEKTSHACLAVSRDLLKDQRVKYGELVFVEGIGYRFVFDCMAARFKNSIDVWVETHAEEKAMGVKSRKVWVIR